MHRASTARLWINRARACLLCVKGYRIRSHLLSAFGYILALCWLFGPPDQLKPLHRLDFMAMIAEIRAHSWQTVPFNNYYWMKWMETEIFSHTETTADIWLSYKVWDVCSWINHNRSAMIILLLRNHGTLERTTDFYQKDVLFSLTLWTIARFFFSNIILGKLWENIWVDPNAFIKTCV